MSNFGRKQESDQPCLRIAVIDDDPLIRSLMSEMLADDGHSVVCFALPEVALAACNDSPFDVVLCDIRMSSMTGIEFYHQLCQTHPAYGRRVVILTGDLHAPDTQRFLLRTGCLYLGKPFRRAQLNAALAIVIASDDSPCGQSTLPRAA
jgi:CheY-like chemotaxis protein